MAGSFFEKKISLFTEYYHTDLVSYTYSITNLFRVFVWVVVIVLPVIVGFT